MTRRQILLSGLFASSLAAQEKYPGVAYRNYSRCLPDHLRDLANSAYERRNRALDKLTNLDAVRERQRWARATFWKLIGGMPERSPLNTRITGGFERSHYRVDKLIYESRPNFHIPANLYIPTSVQPPFPGVLFQMGHSPNGKAAATYQRCCQGLAQLGYLVLAFDPMGQGERIFYPDASGTRTRLSSADEEHSLPGKQMLLTGVTATQFQVWDAIRSLDILASHALVDPQRLATTGQSGGATLSMFLAAVDDRLAAAAVLSGNTENFACEDFNPPGSTDDAEQDFPGSGPLGFDRWDLFYPFAPKPMLISVSDRDFFGTYSPRYISNGWREYDKLKKIYSMWGHADRLAWGDTPLPHGLSYDTRLLIYNWLGRWLKHDREAVRAEPPVALESDETLWSSPAGNVVRSFHGATPHTFTQQRKVAHEAGDIERLLGVERPARGLRANVLGRVPSSGLDIEVLEIQAAEKVWIPAWLFIPKRPDPARAALIALEPSGRLSRWHEGELYQSLASTSQIVCVPDLRGVGDLTPEFSRGAAGYARNHGTEEEYSWASLILGAPLLGQRVTDILALLQALRNHRSLAQHPMAIAALGKMTVPAQFAALLDKNISALYLAGGLLSFRNIVEEEQYNHPFANFVPSVLAHTDLPETVRSIAPRKVVLAGTVDASGKTIDATVIGRLYEGMPHVTLLADPRWDAGRLASFAK